MTSEDKIEGLKWARQSRSILTDVVGCQATSLLSIKRNAEVQNGRGQVPAGEGRPVRLEKLKIWEGCPCSAPDRTRMQPSRGRRAAMVRPRN